MDAAMRKEAAAAQGRPSPVTKKILHVEMHKWFSAAELWCASVEGEKAGRLWVLEDLDSRWRNLDISTGDGQQLKGCAEEGWENQVWASLMAARRRDLGKKSVDAEDQIQPEGCYVECLGMERQPSPEVGKRENEAD